MMVLMLSRRINLATGFTPGRFHATMAKNEEVTAIEQNLLELPHGCLRLPAFFPDGTYGTVRTLDSRDVAGVGTAGIEMNAFHLLMKPGAQTIRTLGGLHAFCAWDGPILTDSGGFQVYSLIRENPKNGEIRKNEIVYRPEGGGKLILTPEKCVQTQLSLGSDIVMCLDICTHPGEAPEIQAESVDTTIRWARRCRTAFDENSKDPKVKLFAIIQGGEDNSLRKYCAGALKEIGFDGYGFGGWPLDSEGRLLTDTLAYTAGLIPDGCVKYAMGLGRPEEIAQCYRMGYTLFDCVIPTREARHQRLYVFSDADNHGLEYLSGRSCYRFHYAIDDAHIRDSRPVDESCDCPLCAQYSRAYLRHLFKCGDSLALRLASLHNLRFYNRFMEMLGQAG